MLKTGDILEDKYRIIDLLGRGGMGYVYLAENMKIGNTWAVKEIDLNRKLRPDILAESEILKKINHPSLPRIVDIIEIGNLLYIVEDYFAGTSLKELIKAREICTEENVLNWARQLCEILLYLHNAKPNPIIYRDMKPGNIIIDQENNVKLIDLGIAREYKESQESDTLYIGTRGYAAPEQYSGIRQTDQRTDIYGLGATLYHAVTGLNPNQPPYHLVPIRQLNKSLSQDLEKVILKCTLTNPELRYQSAGELLGDLRNVRTSRQDWGASVNLTRYAEFTSQLIVIGSLSSRAGSSFITTNLAAAVAANDVPAVVIEAPVNIPYLYDALFIRKNTKVHYLSWSHEIKKGHRIKRHEIFTADGISWIVTDPTLPAIKDWSFDHMMKLIYAVKHIPFVFLDVSTNWSHPSVSSILKQADHIFLVVDPDPVLIDRTTRADNEEPDISKPYYPRESKTIQLLAEISGKEPAGIGLIVNKYTEFIDTTQLGLPFKILTVLSYFNPVEVYKALWEGTLLYNQPDARQVFDIGFCPLMELLIPAGFPAGSRKPRDNLLGRMKAAYKLLKGEQDLQ